MQSSPIKLILIQSKKFSAAVLYNKFDLRIPMFKISEHLNKEVDQFSLWFMVLFSLKSLEYSKVHGIVRLEPAILNLSILFHGLCSKFQEFVSIN